MRHTICHQLLLVQIFRTLISYFIYLFKCIAVWELKGKFYVDQNMLMGKCSLLAKESLKFLMHLSLNITTATLPLKGLGLVRFLNVFGRSV